MTTSTTPDEHHGDDPTSPTSAHDRRRLLKTGAAAAAATVAATIASDGRARADTGDPLILGTQNNAADRTTLDGVVEVRQPRQRAVLAGDPVDEDQEGSSGGPGVAGFSDDGAGVIGSSDGAPGVIGQSRNGYGLKADGGVADVLLARTAKIDFAGGTSFPDGARSVGVVGQMAKEATGTLWYCVDRNTWQRLAGSETSGAFTAIATTRTFDSRAVDSVDKLVGGVTYSVDYENGYDERTNTPLGKIVPEHATALTYNITVAQTEGVGFVRIGPDNGEPPRGSVINWSQNDSIIANSGVVVLDPVNNRNEDYLALAVEIGGTGRTQMILDVTGYYL